MNLFLQGPRTIYEVSEQQRRDALMNVFYSLTVMEDLSPRADENLVVYWKTVLPKLQEFEMFTEIFDYHELLQNMHPSTDGFLWWVRRTLNGGNYTSVEGAFEAFLRAILLRWNENPVSCRVDDKTCIKHFDEDNGKPYFLMSRAVMLGLLKPLGIKRLQWFG